MRRGILGGTFDPPHLAHLMAGECAYHQLGLDVVSMIPAGAPWQKAGREVSDAEHRWAMTQVAVAGVDYFEADDREVRRDGWTYTIDTVASLPDDEEIVLILGADAAAGLTTWHRVDELLARVTVAIVPRPGSDRAVVESAIPRGRVEWLDAPELAISGTDLRARIRSGRSIRFLVRDAVWRYIVEHRLYD